MTCISLFYELTFIFAVPSLCPLQTQVEERQIISIDKAD